VYKRQPLFRGGGCQRMQRSSRRAGRTRKGIESRPFGHRGLVRIIPVYHAMKDDAKADEVFARLKRLRAEGKFKEDAV
ncbi:MAG: hypothetical protein N3A38_06380, partial [Planctomycetota bacterium]|nr:hypothetical protein [Planctomycetota bacterium]